MSKISTDASAEARWREMATRAITRAAIGRALDAAGVIGHDKELVSDRMARHVALVERDGELVPAVVDDAGETRLGSRSLPVTVDALALEFREKYPRNFAARPGASAPIVSTPAPAGSPWKAENPFKTGNLTDQGRLFRADPALYARWRAEAEGRPAPGTASAPGAPAASGRITSHSPPASAPLGGDLGRYFRPGPDFNLTMQGRVFREDRITYERIVAAMAS